MTMRALLRASLIVTVALALDACGGGLSNDDRRAIHAWLTCDDCGAQRGVVGAIGGDAVPELSKALVGPSAEQRSIMRAKFDTSFKVAAIGTRVPGLTAASYADFRDANYLANYQKRAALSLGDIGGDAARAALDGAIADSLGRHYRTDVIRAIKFARSRTDAVTYPGKIVPYSVFFADPVKVVADSAHHLSPQARVVIEDSLFPPSDIPSAVVGDSIYFLSVAAFGLHMISVIPSPSTAPAKVAMFVASIVDANDRAMPACGVNDTTCMVINAPPIPAGHTVVPPPTFFTLTAGTPADAMDFFKIANPAVSALAVTAHIDWRGDGLLDLTWYICGTTSQVGQTVHGTMTHTVQSSVTIPVGGCWVLQVSLKNGQGPVYGKLLVTSP